MLKPARALILLVLSLTSLPLAAAGRELSPRGIGPTTYMAMAPQVAFAGGRFLTVWREYRLELGAPLMAALSDSSGLRISERAFAIDLPRRADASSARLTAAGDGFALVWREHGGPPNMALLDRDGRITATRALPLPGNAPVVAFGSNGTHFAAVVSRQDAARADAFLFDREGRLLRTAVQMPYAASAFDVVPFDDRLLLVSIGEDGLSALTITPGSVTEHTYFEPLVRRGSSRGVAGIARGNGDALLVWSDGAPNTDLKSTIYRTNGTFTPPATIASHAGLLAPLELMPSGDSYVLAFLRSEPAGGNDASVQTIRLDANGAKAGEPVVVDAQVSPRASAATSGSAILVAYETRPYPMRIMAVATGIDGRPREPELLSIAFARQMQPVLTATEENVLALWTEQLGEAPAVRAATIEADGEPNPSSHVTAAFLAADDSAWNGMHHLVVHRDLHRLMATRVAADGTAVDAQPTLLATFDHNHGGLPAAAVVWTGNEWLVVWAHAGQLRLASVLRDGFASVSRPLPVHEPLPDAIANRWVHPPDVAFDGRRVLLVWSEEWYDCCPMPGSGPLAEKTFGALLTPHGMPDGSTSELDLSPQLPRSVASSGNEFMVVAGSRALVIDADQGVVDVTAARELFNWHALSDVTWDGRNYVAALRYRLAKWYVAVRRLDRNGNDLGARGTDTLGPDAFDAPSIAALRPGETVIGLQEGTAAEGARAVIYRESDLTALRPPPAAPTNVRVRSVAPWQSEVRWDASPSADVELYSIELHSNGSWRSIGTVPADTLVHRFYSYVRGEAVRVRAVNTGGASTPAEAVPLVKRRSVR